MNTLSEHFVNRLAIEVHVRVWSVQLAARSYNSFTVYNYEYGIGSQTSVENLLTECFTFHSRHNKCVKIWKASLHSLIKYTAMIMLTYTHNSWHGD